MDDSAASQQLLDEEARAEHETCDHVDRSDIVVGRNPQGSTKIQHIQSTPSTPQSSDAWSQQVFPSPLQHSPLDSPRSCLNDDETMQDGLASPLSTRVEYVSRRLYEVEVPDSQLAPTPSKKARNSRPSPVPTSSFAIPASMHEDRLYTKRRGKARCDTNMSKSALEPEDMSNSQKGSGPVAPETPTASFSQKKRGRKKSYATPPSAAAGLEQNCDASEQASVRQSATHAAEALVADTKQPRKKKSLTHGDAVRKAPLVSPDGGYATVSNVIDNGRSPRAAGKLRRIKKSKPLLPNHHITSQDDSLDSVNPADDMDDISILPADQTPDKTGDAGATSSQAVQPIRAPSPKRRRTNIRKPDLEIPDPQASDHDGDQSPQHAASDAAFVIQDESPDSSSVDEEPPSESPKKKRKWRPNQTNKPRRRFTRKSNLDTSITAAERALNTQYFLEYPLDLPDSGKFTQDEDEILRRAIKDYKERYELDAESLVAIIQWTHPSRDSLHPRKKNNWDATEFEDEKESVEFWEEIKNTQPKLNRTNEIVKRHVQARYSSFKSGAWTEEEDDELKQLMEKYPNQWKLLSLHMGDRSAIDIQNRWKDYVQHGNKRNTSRWTYAEEESLINALTTVIQKDEDERAAGKRPSLAEYSNKDVKWSEVCNLMGNVRSRLQCTVKWTQMKARDASANIHPVYKERSMPSSDLIANPKSRSPSNSRSKKRMRQPESEDHLAPADGSGAVALNKVRKARGHESHRGSGRHDDATEPSKTNRQPKSSENVETDADAAPQQDDVSVLPSRKHLPDSGIAGIKQMRGGDVARLVDVLACSADIQENIDWPRIAIIMKNTWSVEFLQTALKKLLGQVEDQGSFFDTMVKVQSYLEQFDHKILKEFYDPSAANLRKHGEVKSTRVDEEGRGAKASQPNTKRKRMSGGDDPLEPRSVSKKKKKKLRSLASIQKKSKSSTMITESDGDGNE
jgi:hypothetical protein